MNFTPLFCAIGRREMLGIIVEAGQRTNRHSDGSIRCGSEEGFASGRLVSWYATDDWGPPTSFYSGYEL